MGNLLLLSLPLLALSGDPWVDETITVDKAAELAILSELRDDAINMYRTERQSMQLGTGGSVAESQTRFEMLALVARCAWCERDFQKAYRATYGATFAAEDWVNAEKQLLGLGAEGGVLQSVFEAMRRRGQARLILLRYQSIAAQRNVTLQPVTKEMVQELIEAILETASE